MKVRMGERGERRFYACVVSFTFSKNFVHTLLLSLETVGP